MSPDPGRNPYNRQSHSPAVQIPRDEVGRSADLLLRSGSVEQRWKAGRAAKPRDITEIYRTFEEEYRDYLRDLVSAVTDPRLSDAPIRIWERLRQGDRRIPRAELEEALGEPSGSLKLNLADTLYLLEAVGMVRMHGSALRDDPIAVDPIASLIDHFLLGLPRR